MTVERRDRIDSLLALLLPPPQIRTEFSTPRLLRKPSHVHFCIPVAVFEKNLRKIVEVFSEF